MGTKREFEIRPARDSDLDALVSIERSCFSTDRIAPRQYRYLLRHGRAAVLVAESDGGVAGAAVVLFRKGTSLARLYTLAVAGPARGRGAGRGLLSACERVARDRGAVYMRAEIRVDNRASQALFGSLGYRPFGEVADYYQDHAAARRYEKRLVHRGRFQGLRVPYYRQTLDFTCGSACLLMAMKALDPAFPADRGEEIQVWREATTVFMTSGHGGCGPYGLALAAHRRGFEAAVRLTRPSGLFVDSVRDEDKKEVIRLVEDGFRRQVRRAGIPVRFGAVAGDALAGAVQDGRIPVVLISSYRMYEETFPHWVVVTGADGGFVYLHDPYVDEARGKTATDCTEIPVRRAEFERMTRYGPEGRQAVVWVGPGTPGRKKGA